MGGDRRKRWSSSSVTTEMQMNTARSPARPEPGTQATPSAAQDPERGDSHPWLVGMPRARLRKTAGWLLAKPSVPLLQAGSAIRQQCPVTRARGAWGRMSRHLAALLLLPKPAETWHRPRQNGWKDQGWSVQTEGYYLALKSNELLSHKFFFKRKARKCLLLLRETSRSERLRSAAPTM